MKSPTALLPTALLLSLPLAAQDVVSDDHGRRAAAQADAGAAAPVAPRESAAALGATWEPLGPFGGDVDDVAARPGAADTVLAGIAPNGGVGGTLYRSTDAAATWSQVGALSGTSVHDLEWTPDGSTAYAGTVDAVWRSTDGGASWTQLPLGIGLNDQVFEVTLDPSSPTTLWVGVADAIGSQTKNVLRSTDGGATWTDLTPAGAAGTSCRAIAVDPTDSSHVFAAFGGAFGGGSVWRTTNGGASWTNVSSGLPANPMKDVLFDAADLSRVLVCGGQLFGSQFVGVFETTNGGASWNALHDGTWPNLVIHDLEQDPADSAVLYAASAGSGVYRSTDGGTTWSFGVGGTDGFSVNEVAVAPSGGAPVYLGAASGAVWKSPSGGDFAPSSVGIGSLNTVSAAGNPLQEGELAVAFQGLNNGGVFTSLDGGVTWDLEPLPGTRYNTVAFAPDGTLYAISDGPTTIAPEGVYRRDPGGWVSLGPDQGPVFESELVALEFSETDPGLILTGGSDFGVAGHEPTIWRSTDGGATWLKAFEGSADFEDVQDIALLPDGTDTVAVAAFTDFGASPQAGGVLRSTDGGVTWAPSMAGLPADPQFRSISVSPLDPQMLLLGNDKVGSGGLFRSTDGGASWASTGFSLEVRGVEHDPLLPDVVHVARFQSPKAMVSTDGGATFTANDSGLGSAGTTRGLAMAEGPCNRVLFASGSGVFAADASCRLAGTPAQVSLSAGGQQDFTLLAGPANAGASYWLVGSASGTSPGIVVAGLHLPLNLDPYLVMTASNPNQPPLQQSFGTLDPAGAATAAFAVPPGAPPSLAGLTLHHAFGVFVPAPLQTLLASNPVAVELVP